MTPLADGSVTGPVISGSVALLVGVFGGGGLVALLRVNADKGRVVIEAAQGAVIVQTSVIDALREELDRVKAEVVALRGRNDAQAQQIAEQSRQLALQAEQLAALGQPS